jgi:hypothetical protein
VRPLFFLDFCAASGRMRLAHPTDAMSVATLPENVTYTISQTGNGWLLVIENPHCSLSQVFHSSQTARQAVDRTAFALETLTAQHLERQRQQARDTRNF